MAATNAAITVTKFGLGARPGELDRVGNDGADWPGLGVRDLYEGRDLKATTDLRSVMKSLVHDHLQVATAAVDGSIFPNSSEAPATRDLVRV